MQKFRPGDVDLLMFLSAATKQYDPILAVLRQIDTIAGPPVDDIFANSAKPLYARQISFLKTIEGG